MQRKSQVGSNYGFNGPSQFLAWASKQAGAKGNAPGFNSQFQYPEGAQTNTNAEYIDGSFDAGRAIPQISTQRKLISGNYHSMVEDTPFDIKAYNKQKQNLMAVGLAFLLVGVIIYYSK
jgi:hypothetical protein